MATCCNRRSMSRHHALAISFPGPSHVNPLMRFCRRLAAQQGFIITFLSVEPTNNPTTIDVQEVPAVHQQAEGNTRLDIRKAHIAMPDLSPSASAEGCTASMIERIFAALHCLTPQLEQFLLLLLQQDPPITCLILDMFMMEAAQCLADKYNLPTIALYASCQSMLLLLNYILEGVVPLEEVVKAVDNREELRDNIFKEGLKGLPPIKVGALLFCPGENFNLYTHTLRALQETKSKAHAIVVNSFKELEGEALEVPIGIPVYGIGPLIEPLEKGTNSSFWEEDEGCMLWLDLQPPSSVLFISFGSFVPLTIPQFEEFVAGLLSSQQRFLFVFRPNLVQDAPYSKFREDLLARSHAKGFVTNWVPQARVLSHPSIHSFLTHCGWNSTVEAIGQGVPLLCFPYFADQSMNAKFIIEEWKVGLGFEENKGSTRLLIGREEVEEAVLTLFEREEGEHLHVNAKNLKRACDQSCSENGYASKNIQDLVSSLEKKAESQYDVGLASLV